ncbi:MAG: DNA mismatch repair protein MutS [Rickettsiales bacterium]|nr:DNA mismatch repair protein MutS [Rickettsiales bacterium]
MSDAKATPMVAQYLGIKERYRDYLLMYRMGDFYELFFDDAKTAAAALDIALTSRGTYGGEKIPMCGIPHHAFSSYIPKLIKKGYKVAICDQAETPEEAAARGGKSVLRREVSRIITAGTLTEDSLIPTSFNNYLAAVAFKDGLEPEIALALSDISTGDFEVKYWDENAVSELMSFAILERPSEIIIPEKILGLKKFEPFVEAQKERLVAKPDSFFNATSARKSIMEAFSVADTGALGNFSEPEIMAMGGMLSYIELTQIGRMPALKHPAKKLASDFLQIDASSTRNLEIFDSLDARGGELSLFRIMDRTKTPMGRRWLRNAIARPLSDAARINARLDSVEFFAMNPDLTDRIRECLAGASDIERIMARLALGRAGPRDILNVGRTLALSAPVKEMLAAAAKNSIADPVAGITGGLARFKELADRIGSAIVYDPPASAAAGGFVKEGFSAALDEYRRLSTNTKQVILELQAKYALATSVMNLKIKYNNIVGYFVEVPGAKATALMDPKSGFRHKQTLVSGVRFTTDELLEIEQKILVANEKYLALELEIFKGLGDEILGVRDSIEKYSKALAELDGFSALAALALDEDYVRPAVDGTLAFEIRGGRHPIVESAMRKTGTAFIPNDALLEDRDESSRLWLLTGPNMAGKSTFLRAGAIMVVMAQAGSFVPAASAHIGVVDRLFSRVGASDNLAQGLSTFMVEMSETAAILNQATERSFVILDEIGRGTATFDGLSIAWAVLEYLNNISRCRGLFATHYHELTEALSGLAHVTPHTLEVKEFDGGIVFMHRVALGVADRSYGIHVARRAGIPEAVTSRAERILETLESGEASGSARKNIRKLADGDLFTYKSAPARPASAADGKLEKLAAKLRALDPDELSPKTALEILYEIKGMV